MKAKTLCSALLATLVFGGAVAYADTTAPSPMTTNGKVKVEDGTIDPDDGKTDPEDPDKKLPDLPDIKPNPNPMGPLEISHASDIQFGTIKTATKEVSAFATPNKWTDADDVEQTRGVYLQFGDLRTAQNGYTVNAKMTKQFTQGTNELTGSTITLTNPYSNTSAGSTGVKPKFEPKVELSYNESALIATADKAVEKSGKGMWAVEFGYSATAPDTDGTDTTANSVELLVPANTASSMAGGDYVSDIEWSITAAP